MLAKETLSERYVTTSEVKEILKNRSEDDELRYEQRTALDYATRFSRASADEARGIVNRLVNEIDGVKEHQAVMIVNLLPVDEDDLELIFAKERIRLDQDKIDSIMEIANSTQLIELSEIESELEKNRVVEEETEEAEEEGTESQAEEEIEESQENSEEQPEEADESK